MGLLNLFKSAPTKDVSVETGGLRDLYMKHIEDASLNGTPVLPFPQFIQMLRQQEILRQQQLNQNLSNAPNSMFK